MSTAVTPVASTPRLRKPPAISQGIVAWLTQEAGDVPGSNTFQWGTGAPNHTAPISSIWWRTDAASAATLLYRNTDGAATWEAAAITSATLATANTWDLLQTYTVGARIVDSGVIEFGTAGADLVLTADGTDVVVTGTGGLAFVDSVVTYFGTGKDIGVTWDATKLLISQATANSAIHFGVSGAGIDINLFGDTVGADWTWDQTADSALWGDNAKAVFGAGNDLTVVHDGTNTTLTSTTGHLTIDNTAATKRTILRVGTNTAATSVDIRSDADVPLFRVDGAGTISAGVDMWGGCPSVASASVTTHAFFDDFIASVFSATQWVLTADAGGTATIGDGQHGEATITCAATTDNDGNQIVYAQETFKLTEGKRLWFEARIKSASGDMTNSDWFVGLIEAEDLTGVADNMPANGIGFHKEDGAATFSASSSDNAVNLETAAVGTIVNDTYIRIGLLFDGGASGAATITPYIDGVAGTPIASVTYATMAEMAPAFMVRNGDGTTTQTLVVDYIKAVAER